MKKRISFIAVGILIMLFLGACNNQTNLKKETNLVDSSIGTSNVETNSIKTPSNNDSKKGNSGSDDKITRLETLIDNNIKSNDFSGCVVIADQEKILVNKGYGMADYENKIPNAPDIKFNINSMTKSFTATGIAMLQEKGLLSTKDLISKYVPDFPQGDKLTIQNLLTHSSGIPDYNISYSAVNTPEEHVNLMKANPLEFAPGSKYKYANSNFILLGYIIEKVSKVTWQKFMEDNIFIPLEMKNTGYDTCEKSPQKAIGYNRIATEPQKAYAFSNMSAAYSAAGLVSTANDLYKWDQALYTEKLMKKDTLAKMFTPYISINDPKYEGYGFGWFVIKKGENPTVVHYGCGPGFNSGIYRDEAAKRTIIILSNSGNFWGGNFFDESKPFTKMQKDIISILDK